MKVLEHQVSAVLSGRLSVTLEGSVSHSVPGYTQSHTAGLGKVAQEALWEEPKPVLLNYIVPRLTRGSLKP